MDNNQISPKEFIDDASTTVDDNNKQRSRMHRTRSSTASTNNDGTTTNNVSKRQKNITCYVCGAKANGYNFDQITCESCKAFFRRNALKSMDRFRCRNSDNCVITSVTRKRCKKCRLTKCFKVGMRKEWILTDEEKFLKRKKIERNRLIKQQAQIESQRKLMNNSTLIIPKTTTTPVSLIYMSHPSDRHIYQREKYLLDQLSNGYQFIAKQYPQPKKFLHRNTLISQTENIDIKLSLVKDLTRELTQMTTLRLLNFFNLIPEFQLLTKQEKQSLLFENMLTIFMFHGALTYNSTDDTFVDRTTDDQPYDAKYLLFVYGPKVYNNFVALSRQLTTTIYRFTNDKQTDEYAHMLFLLLMTILLFSSSSQINLTDNIPTKVNKIQQFYVDIVYRVLNDQYGLTIGRQMFNRLVPLLDDLRKLCSSLANVNLCEMVEEEDQSMIVSYNRASNYYQQTVPSISMTTTSEFNPAMISGRSHLNELQKENRAPPTPPILTNSVPFSIDNRSSPWISSNPLPPPVATTTIYNNQL